MGLNVSSIVGDIYDALQAGVPQKVYRQGVPDLDSLRRDSSGKVQYYLAVQFGMPQKKTKGRTFAGVRHDDYELPVYIQVVGPDAAKVESIAFDKVLDVMIGFTTDYAAYTEQRPGGAVFPMTQSNGATEAYVYPMSFGLTFQMNPTT